MENTLLLIYIIGVIITFIILVVQAISAFRGLKEETESRFQSISLHTIFILIIVSFFVWLSWIAVIGFLIEYVDKKKKRKELSN